MKDLWSGITKLSSGTEWASSANWGAGVRATSWASLGSGPMALASETEGKWWYFRNSQYTLQMSTDVYSRSMTKIHHTLTHPYTSGICPFTYFTLSSGSMRGRQREAHELGALTLSQAFLRPFGTCPCRILSYPFVNFPWEFVLSPWAINVPLERLEPSACISHAGCARTLTSSRKGTRKRKTYRLCITKIHTL